MSLTFAVERLYDCFEDIKAISDRHYDEVGIHREGVPLDIDWQRYLQIESDGLLLLVIARCDGKLVGYHDYLVHRPLRYKQNLFAESDVFFLLHGHRGGMAGMRLLSFGEKHLKALGVKVIVTRCKLHRHGVEQDKEDIGPLFEALGYRAIERVYQKNL